MGSQPAEGLPQDHGQTQQKRGDAGRALGLEIAGEPERASGPGKGGSCVRCANGPVAGYFGRGSVGQSKLGRTWTC